MMNNRERKTWIVVVLTIISPLLGMLYLGRGWRTLVYLMISISGLGVIFLLAARGVWPSGVDYSVFLFSIFVIGLLDAIRIQQHSEGVLPSPWYSRWRGLVSIVIAFVGSVLIFRWLVMEPFRIPARSMAPVLIPQDQFVVDKSIYGIRFPFSQNVLVEGEMPKRGDVVVFNYPITPSIQYVKRVVALPGDEIVFEDKEVRLNGQLLQREKLRYYSGSDSRMQGFVLYKETLDDREYQILLNDSANGPPPFCYALTSGPVTVPENSFVVLGDNRDSSNDSRCWGFVDRSQLIGKAQFIFWNQMQPDRVGNTVK